MGIKLNEILLTLEDLDWGHVKRNLCKVCDMGANKIMLWTEMSTIVNTKKKSKQNLIINGACLGSGFQTLKLHVYVKTHWLGGVNKTIMDVGDVTTFGPFY